jgi:hypothetical protein
METTILLLSDGTVAKIIWELVKPELTEAEIKALVQEQGKDVTIRLYGIVRYIQFVQSEYPATAYVLYFDDYEKLQKEIANIEDCFKEVNAHHYVSLPF